MAYNEYLADRVSNSLKENRTGFEKKKMFGGMAYLVDDKLCVGVFKDELMVRIAPANQNEYLLNEDCRLMDDSGKSMHGFLLISPEGIDMDEDLDKWVKRSLEFNPKAKSSKKRKL